jgi:fructokinase
MRHQVKLVSGVGDDPLGRSALAAIGKIGLETRFIQTVAGFPTGTASVMLGADGQPSFQIERPAAYDAVELSAADLGDLSTWSPGWLYYGTLYSHLKQARSKLQQIMDAVPTATRFYDVNLRPGCFSAELVVELLSLANVVKLNEEEMRSVAQFAGLPQAAIESFCREGAARYGWQTVAVTLGPNGSAIWNGGDYAEEPGQAVSVADSVGAGDGFAAAMLHGLSQQWGTRDIVSFANRVGALVASRAGAIPDWSPDEIALFVESGRYDRPNGKSSHGKSGLARLDGLDGPVGAPDLAGPPK